MVIEEILCVENWYYGKKISVWIVLKICELEV